MVVEWATVSHLRLPNGKASNTCVGQRGKSIVDLTLTNPAVARRVTAWKVSREETLLDHLYIRVLMTERAATTRGVVARCKSTERFAHYDEDLLAATAMAVTWMAEASSTETAGGQASERYRCCFQACFAKRTGAVYWWTGELNRYTRSQRRGRVDVSKMAALYDDYRDTHRSLHRFIKDAKARAWEQLLAALESDPWERSYRMVQAKLRPWTPPVTETMELLDSCDGSLPTSGGRDEATNVLAHRHRSGLDP
ncbi:unnamed protein product [Heterotrigona itama]|uniref:Endonuclease/exonuclease/phosphatase domain-containing protein n=1 Tax=Heterotrigona itama TaxID=395501 RepID=A0A6V7HJN3_9HYME|nr:unnamed protein product [Heterotrigona itama]